MDDRRINQGIRMPGKKDDNRFTRGVVITDPEELAKAAGEKDSGIDLQSLYDSGVISGTWKGVKVASEAPAKKEK